MESVRSAQQAGINLVWVVGRVDSVNPDSSLARLSKRIASIALQDIIQANQLNRIVKVVLAAFISQQRKQILAQSAR